jgi:hypothetical protein
MDDSVEKAVAGLVVAAIGGLTFVAYRHPIAYAKLGVWLGFINVLLGIGTTGWNISNYTLLTAIMTSGLVGDKTTEVNGIANKLVVSPWWMAAIVCFSFYHMFLLSFPRWLLEDEPPKNVDNQK